MAEQNTSAMTWSQAEQPTRLRMTYEEFLQWADEDVHAEWINGEVIVHRPPKNFHQVIVECLERLLALFVEAYGLGLVRIAPFEMRLQVGGESYEPDIRVLRRENLSRLTEERLEGPADLVIEVVSHGSVGHERDIKFRDYEAAGIRESWIIDSRPNRRRADFYRLDEHSAYRLFATEDDEKVFSAVLPVFWLEPVWLWAEEMPSPLTAFGEIVGLSDELTALMQKARQKGLQSDQP